MSDLPREVLKWLQSLDLSHQVRNIRRDFSNGYLIAEIFSWYFPDEIQMHSFNNGTSIETKQGNWSIIERFFSRVHLDIPRDEIEGTIHCKPRAALLLVQRIYNILTSRCVAGNGMNGNTDFTDSYYQSTLPPHARSTASQAIKNNIAISELHTDPDRILCQQKAKDVIQLHIENRQLQRKLDPNRYGIKSNPCQRRLTNGKGPSSVLTETDENKKTHHGNTDLESALPLNSSCKEIIVNQSSIRVEDS